MNLFQKHCKHCGTPFETIFGDQYYCNEFCARKAKRSRRTLRARGFKITGETNIYRGILNEPIDPDGSIPLSLIPLKERTSSRIGITTDNAPTFEEAFNYMQETLGKPILIVVEPPQPETKPISKLSKEEESIFHIAFGEAQEASRLAHDTIETQLEKGNAAGQVALAAFRAAKP